MGKVKLTLTIEESLVEEAKQGAKKNNKSLSSVIEAFLSEFNSKQMNKGRKIAENLRGIAKSPLSDMTDKEIRDLRINENFQL